MKGRNSRLKSIKKLIKNNRIESQEILLGLLQKEGYEHIVDKITLKEGDTLKKEYTL